MDERKHLVVSRKEGETIVLQDPDWDYQIVVDLAEIRGDKARIGIAAPKRVTIWRSELEPFRGNEPMVNVQLPITNGVEH